MTLLPRIRGRVGTAFDEKTNENLGFTWELFIIVEAGEGDGDRFQCPKVFKTEAEAQASLMEACQMACEMFEKEFVGEVSGKFLDMKTNEVRRWDKKDKH